MSAYMVNSLGAVSSKFNRSLIILVLEKFREAHAKEYSDALDVYREDVQKKLDELGNRVLTELPTTTEFKVQHNLGLTVPINCDNGYKDLIALFNSTSEDEIKLSFAEANHIFNNKWDWIESATVSNSYYYSRKK